MTTPETITDESGSHDVVKPSGTLAVSGLSGLQAVTESSVRASMLGELAPIKTNLNTGFLKNLGDRIAEAISGVARRTGFEKLFSVGQVFRDGQVALRDRVDLISTLLDYGSVYMETAGGLLSPGENSGTMLFTKQIGPMRGCHLDGGGIVLDKPGLWDIRAQLHFGRIHLGSGRVEWRVAVFTPSGTLFSEQRSKHDSAYVHTQTVVSSVVVPDEGYVVKVEVYWIQAFRELAGGPANNRLTVQHISNRTDVGATGSEESDKWGTAEGSVIGDQP